MGRFINADALVSTGQGLLGNNMFAYCNNNPVLHSDRWGYMITSTYYGDGEINDRELIGGAGGALAMLGASVAYAIFSEARAKKPPNLPSRKKVTLDLDHIISGHMPNGDRNTDGKKSVFWGLTVNQMIKAIYEAYSTASKYQTQGDRIRLRGYSDSFGLVIEMWLNVVEEIIETAYPK